MSRSAGPDGQGLVTPPGPRSLSSDSMRPGSRKKHNGSSRRRTKSPAKLPHLSPIQTLMRARNLLRSRTMVPRLLPDHDRVLLGQRTNQVTRRLTWTAQNCRCSHKPRRGSNSVSHHPRVLISLRQRGASASGLEHNMS